MRQISDFLAERATEAAEHLVYVPSTQATGVLWTTGQVVTTAPGATLVQTAAVTPSPEPTPVTLSPVDRFSQAGWVVVVARNSDGTSISASGILGGSAQASCGSTPIRKLLFNVPLDAAFAGGGVFDISGDLIGVVVRCGETWTAISHTTVQRLLEEQLGADAVAWHDFGVHVRTPSETERLFFRLPPGGLFVTEVRRTSRAFNMGLRPGDLLTRTGEDPLEQPEDLLALGDMVTVVRDGRPMQLLVTPPFSADQPLTGVVLTSVQPGTRLHAAGLRPGDRIVYAGGSANPTTAELNRIVTRREPAWVIYERDDRHAGVLLP